MFLLGLVGPGEAAQGIGVAFLLCQGNHGRVHLGELVGLTGDGGLQVLDGVAHFDVHLQVDGGLTHLHQHLVVVGGVDALGAAGGGEELFNERVALLGGAGGIGCVLGAGGAFAYDGGLEVVDCCHGRSLAYFRIITRKICKK